MPWDMSTAVNNDMARADVLLREVAGRRRLLTDLPSGEAGSVIRTHGSDMSECAVAAGALSFSDAWDISATSNPAREWPQSRQICPTGPEDSRRRGNVAPIKPPLGRAAGVEFLRLLRRLDRYRPRRGRVAGAPRLQSGRCERADGCFSRRPMGPNGLAEAGFQDATLEGIGDFIWKQRQRPGC